MSENRLRDELCRLPQLQSMCSSLIPSKLLIYCLLSFVVCFIVLFLKYLYKRNISNVSNVEGYIHETRACHEHFIYPSKTES